MQCIIFTDVDGSLLNHGDYSFSEAMPALERIRRSDIPLILVTSKTRREVESIHRALNMREPFVVENGAAVYFPAGYRGLFAGDAPEGTPIKTTQLGISYGRIRSFMQEIKDRFHVRGFGDLSVQEIAALTGLPPEQAELAARREFTEPFVMEPGEDMDTLRSMAADRDIKITRGGRFCHMIGMHQDKGTAVKHVRHILDRRKGEKHLAVGLGDSDNDLTMLQEVDIPVLIPNPAGSCPEIHLPGLIKADAPGAKGWNDVVERILNEIERNHM